MTDPPKRMFVTRWQLLAMMSELGESATVADLEAFAENLFHEPVEIVLYDECL